jgi:hypothetical protein
VELAISSGDLIDASGISSALNETWLADATFGDVPPSQSLI